MGLGLAVVYHGFRGVRGLAVVYHGYRGRGGGGVLGLAVVYHGFSWGPGSRCCIPWL